MPVPSIGSSLALSCGLQAAAWALSTIGRDVPTEHYYDASGALTHLALVIHAVGGAAAARARAGSGVMPDARVALLGALSSIWAIRLGTYLADRVARLGKDDRFDALKSSPTRWAIPWAAQSVWCFLIQSPLTLCAAAAATAVTASGTPPRLGRLDAIGVGIFVGGLALEVTADMHKDAAKRARPTAPVCTGPFRYSVYPAYFGECALWCGAVVLASTALAARPLTLAFACLSPAFTATLLWRVSGIPLLESTAWRKYGTDEAWLKYRAQTSLFVPWPPAASVSAEDMARVRTRGAAAQRKLQ